MTLSTPNFSFLTPPSRRDTSRRGATLLVTLGILTVLSVMAVTFLVAARLQRQTAAGDQNRLIARNYIDAGLHHAMRQIEDALTYPNFTDHDSGPGEFLTLQRLAPVGQWFSTRYTDAFQLSRDVSFMAPDALASPTVEGSPYVNLLTPQVLRLVPAALTNGLSLSANDTRPLRSGWIPLDLLPTNAPVEMRLHSKSARIAFAVFDCSGFLDANTFISGPTTQKLPRVCFSQADVDAWLPQAKQTYAERFTAIDSALDLNDPKDSPFFHLSYDPDPDVYPLHYDCYETCTSLGRRSFGAGLHVDLNLPQAYRALAALKEQAYYCRFNLNSLTNHLARGTASTDVSAPWFNDENFKVGWLDPTVFLLEMMRQEEPATTLHRWPDSSHLAWTIANFMDADRIPQVSDFPTEGTPDPDLATRADYAVEDVPLINKVTVFNIYDDDEVIKAPQKPSYYDLPSSGLSNHYAVAVELWYPFAPRAPGDDPACYVGIYTNAEDVVTTTNRPWTGNELRDWFNWNNPSNSVMRTLFYSWANAYTNQVGPSIWRHPLWQTVTGQGDLWFTPSMTNHPSWPVADADGGFSITNTPIWQAFYPATYEVAFTNQVEEITTDDNGVATTNMIDVVSTNVYTYLNITNAYVEAVSEADLSTNRLVGQIGTTTPEPFPVLLWSNLTTSAYSTNVLGAVLTPDDTLIAFYSPGVTNTLYAIDATPDGLIGVVVSNDLTGAVSTNSAAALVLAPWGTNGLIFAAQTNLFVTTEITPVAPLPMPEDLGLALSALLLLMPTDSLSSLYTFLMLTPAEFTPDMWRELLDTFSQNPSILNRLMPSHQEPTLGYMTEEDRHALTEESYAADNGDVDFYSELDPTTFTGYFWTVYPKQTVAFMDVVATTPVEGQGGLDSEYQAVTNYHALGAALNGKINTIWLRPVVTVNPNGDAAAADEENPLAGDKIVDEALLTYRDDNPVPVWGWTAVTNLCIPDPRRNAYAREWRAFSEPWPTVVNTTNLNTGVHEMPFIHADEPFSAIGDIGHVYAAYQRPNQEAQEGLSEQEKESDFMRQLKYDTLTFSTRAGASLLDIFTVSPTNGPRRGLVQANTQHAPVIKALLADVKVGWRKDDSAGIDESGWKPLYETSGNIEAFADVYVDALTNAPYSIGWRSYADMLPNLSTNRLFEQRNVWGASSDLHSKHDYTEDVLRGLVGKVSFRQNVFVIVVAAQALSPASTDAHAVVLAEQRAAVTVIRDAYTGKWVIHDWVWLTE